MQSSILIKNPGASKKSKNKNKIITFFRSEEIVSI